MMHKGTVILALLAGLCCTAAVFFAGQVQTMAETVSIRWAEGGVSPAQLVRQEAYGTEDRVEHWPEATLWQEVKDRAVSDGDIRDQNADLIWIFGDGAAVLSSKMLRGSYPARSDTEGCAVSEALANALWGGIDVLGMPLHLEGAVYYVRGVFQGSEQKVMAQRDRASEEAMPHLQLGFSEGGGRAEAEDFLRRINAGSADMLDMPLLSWAMTLLSALPAAVLALGLLWRLLRKGLALRSYPILFMRFLPLLLAGAALTVFCLGTTAIPARLLPGRWSDFAFWSRQFGSFGGSLVQWFSGAFVGQDTKLLLCLLWVILFSVLGAWGLLTVAQRVQVRALRQWMLLSLAALVGLGLLSWLFAGLGGVGFRRELYLMPVLWMAMDFALHRYDAYIQISPERRERINAALDESPVSPALERLPFRYEEEPAGRG